MRWWQQARDALGPQEVVLGVGLALTSAGSALVYPPAGLIVPGVVLTWLAIAPAPRRP